MKPQSSFPPPIPTTQPGRPSVIALGATPSPSGAERRRHPRYPVLLQVEFKTEYDFVLEHATNISSGGLFVRTSLRPPCDSKVEIRLKLPNGQILESTARVAHHLDAPAPGGVGLELPHDDPELTAALDAYIASLL